MENPRFFELNLESCKTKKRRINRVRERVQMRNKKGCVSLIVTQP